MSAVYKEIGFGAESLSDLWIRKKTEFTDYVNSPWKSFSKIIKGASLYPILYGLTYLFRQTVFTEFREKALSETIFSCPPPEYLTPMYKCINTPLVLYSTGLVVPLIEEILFREVIQKEILNHTVSTFLNLLAPQHVTTWKGAVGKCTRIALGTLLFSGIHAFNQSGTLHALEVIPLGLLLSVMQETESYGIVSAVGLHAINNMSAAIIMLYKINTEC